MRASRTETRACAQCQTEFSCYASRKVGKYCSKSCARTALNLTAANPSHSRDISGERNPMYGKAGLAGPANPMYGRLRERSPRWTGGRLVRKDGYVLVVVPEDHPYGKRKSRSRITPGPKYLLEHRYVMEQHLGRYLDPKEVVHHRDENPSNNAIENLELFESQAAHIRLGHGSH